MKRIRSGRVRQLATTGLVLVGGLWSHVQVPAQSTDAGVAGDIRISRYQDEPRQPTVPSTEPEEDRPEASDVQPDETRPRSDESRFNPRRTDPFADVRAARISRRPSTRLASVPNMFGDVFGVPGTLVLHQGASFTNGVAAELPMAGGSRRVKIGENNRSLPTDRVFATYQHFHNALSFRSEPGEPTSTFDESVDRVTLGFEKTFYDGQFSVEVRMPFVNDYNVNVDTMGAPPFDRFSLTTGEFGNLAVILKHLIHETDTTAMVLGLGIDTPTGSSVVGRTYGTDFRVHNDSLHLLPYLGWAHQPDSPWFFNAFAQLDLATNGNRVEIIDDPQIGPDSLGVYTEQNLLYLDVGTGYWLYRDPCACRLTGVAALAELHYTTSLQDTDVIDDNRTNNNLMLFNPINRFDVLNLTVGLHTEVANTTTIRAAGVFPLRNDQAERPFDAEFQLQINRRF